MIIITWFISLSLHTELLGSDLVRKVDNVHFSTQKLLEHLLQRDVRQGAFSLCLTWFYFISLYILSGLSILGMKDR